MGNVTARRELAAGCVLIVVGVGVAVQSFRYRIGTLGSMGPGYFPLILGGVLTVVGVLIVLNRHSSAEEEEGDVMISLDGRGGFYVVAGVLSFAVLAAYAGFAPATFACVFISAMGDRTATLRTSLLLATAATVIGMLLFAYALRMPLPIWRWGTP